MTTPISFTHSPFQYHHVPNSPYLMPARPHVAQSPVPFVPDIDNLRENRHSTNGLLRNGKNNKSLKMFYLLGRGVLPEKFDGGVQPTCQNPCSIKLIPNLWFSLPCLWPEKGASKNTPSSRLEYKNHALWLISYCIDLENCTPQMYNFLFIQFSNSLYINFKVIFKF